MIRLINKQDIKNLIKLEEESFNHTLGEEFFVKASENEFCYFYLYEENNEILGYISSIFDGEIIEILNFCVSKKRRREGIGVKLMNELLINLLKKGANSAILEVRESNIPAISFYEAFGFKKINVRKNYYNDGENALVLQKVFTNYLDIYQSYYENITNVKRNKEYIIIKNDELKNKYDFNKFIIIDNDIDKIIKKIKKENDNNYLEIESFYSLNKYFNKENIIDIMFSNIKNLNIEIKYDNIKELNENNYDDYINILYLDSLKYASDYKKLESEKIKNIYLNSNKYKAYLIYDNDKVVGFINVFIFFDNIYVKNFYIKDEYRNKHYGKSLFMYMINEMKNNNIYNVYLNTYNDDYIKEIYKKWGFDVINKYYAYHEDV